MAEVVKINNVDRLRDEINLYFHKITFRGSRETSHQLALRIASYFRDIVNYGKYKSMGDLVDILTREGELLYSAHSTEFLIRNMLLSSLKIVREEALRLASGADEVSIQTESLNRLWFLPSNIGTDVDVKRLKSGVLASLDEFRTEVESSGDTITNQALQHILSSDVVITYKLNASGTLKKFFSQVKAKTLYSVDDDVSCPANKFFSQVKAKTLYSVDDDVSCPANVVSSMDILTVMRTATRVVISAAAILPDGSCVSNAGTLNLCLAAKRHSVPVIVCAAFYKLTPMFIPHLDEFNVQGPPTDILPASEALKFSNVFVANPLFDRIPSNLISLFITESSAVSPSHVYRLVAEYYHPEDFRQLNR
uniref:Translation initiation factor eIF-2B subunit beta n=1 Tax=Panagrolaimus sp. JU765 TaxID=591449 RepID=A0AC34Q6S5_9BILA